MEQLLSQNVCPGQVPENPKQPTNIVRPYALEQGISDTVWLLKVKVKLIGLELVAAFLQKNRSILLNPSRQWVPETGSPQSTTETPKLDINLFVTLPPFCALYIQERIGQPETNEVNMTMFILTARRQVASLLNWMLTVEVDKVGFTLILAQQLSQLVLDWSAAVTHWKNQTKLGEFVKVNFDVSRYDQEVTAFSLRVRSSKQLLFWVTAIAVNARQVIAESGLTVSI